MDLGYQGPRLTWCNKQSEGIICKKLDRLMVNKRWLDNTHSHIASLKLVDALITYDSDSIWNLNKLGRDSLSNS